MNITIISRSPQSFIDLCDNELVNEKNIHCTFNISNSDRDWMIEYFKSKGGETFSSTINHPTL